jgi:hypothetical protein
MKRDVIIDQIIKEIKCDLDTQLRNSLLKLDNAQIKTIVDNAIYTVRFYIDNNEIQTYNDEVGSND